jgi:hypothetical protein
VENVGKKNELHVPITLCSTSCKKTVTASAVIDSGAAGTCINEGFIKRMAMTSHKLSKPFPIRMADGKVSQAISCYCNILVWIDQRNMFGKFNISKISDDILLGHPWMAAMNPNIDWTRGTVSLQETPRSAMLERWCNKHRKKNNLPPLDFTEHDQVQMQEFVVKIPKKQSPAIPKATKKKQDSPP